LNIAIVSPWQNHLELAKDYFEAVLPEMEEGDELLVVDNASEPPLRFGNVRSEENLGYCGGNNLGLDKATADAVLFANNDIALARRGWLNEIREALEPGVLVGPMRWGAHANVDGHELPYLDGWCIAGMRHDFIKLGGFNEGLQEPAYFSDNYLCLEARAAGMTLREVRVGLVHKENSTAGPAWDERVRAATTVNHAIYQARVRELMMVIP
jgi:GT2 family glycosyltransferase